MVRVRVGPSARSAVAFRIAAVAVGGLPLLWLALHGAGAHPALLDGWFELQCGQDPSRRLAVPGLALPVCARCLGLYLGLATGALLARPDLGRPALARWIWGAALVMLVDVASERVGSRGSWPALRVFTGLLLAHPLGVVFGRAGGGAPAATRD